MNVFQIPLLALLLSAVPACSQLSWQVPNGRPVMIDGRLDGGEWDDAAVKDLPGLAKVRIKQSDQYVFLAITLNSGDGTVDLYLSPSPSEVYDLHASAKLGERRLQNGAWPEWNWWNNAGWMANTSRAESFQRGSFLPTATREFQISKTRFPGSSWKLMFEVTVPTRPNWTTDRYPKDATSANRNDWIQLDLEQTRTQSPSIPGGQPAGSCSAPEYRQFDFWVGDWDVFDSDKPGRAVAHARVSRILDGCVLLEDYVGTNGTHGQSFNIFDASTGMWRQSWVTNRGQFLLLEGKADGTGMVFTGSDRTADGKERQVRGTWQPISGGVRESAVRSLDGGKTWEPWFDIVFRPHGE